MQGLFLFALGDTIKIAIFTFSIMKGVGKR